MFTYCLLEVHTEYMNYVGYSRLRELPYLVPGQTTQVGTKDFCIFSMDVGVYGAPESYLMPKIDSR